MSKLNIVSENVHVEQLADVFLFVISAQIAVLEFGPNIGHFFVDSLLFLLLCPTLMWNILIRLTAVQGLPSRTISDV